LYRYVTVGFGDDTVRLKLSPNMSFADLMVRLQDSIEVGKYLRINRSTYRVKPFYLSSETVLPIE
jgi:hypothetical protein